MESSTLPLVAAAAGRGDAAGRTPAARYSDSSGWTIGEASTIPPSSVVFAPSIGTGSGRTKRDSGDTLMAASLRPMADFRIRRKLRVAAEIVFETAWRIGSG